MSAPFGKALRNISALLRHPFSANRRRDLRTARPDAATRRLYEESARHALSSGAENRVVLVSHDAQPHGAELLALNLVRSFARERIGMDVLMLGDGALLPHFAEVATLHRISTATQPRGEILDRLKGLRENGAKLAIVNTTVGGRLIPLLREAGFFVLVLVHELPGMLRRYDLKEHARAIAADADLIVFSAKEVQQGFEAFAGVPVPNAIIRPQGLYARSDRSLDRARLGGELHREFGIPPDSKIILNVGYADRRKGFDLFVEMALAALSELPEAVAVWVGGADKKLRAAGQSRMRAEGLENRFFMTGNVAKPQRFYLAADVLAFTSREDPFPSVVLEALDAQLPVIAFGDSGGFGDLLKRGCGVLVPKSDGVAMAQEVLRLMRDPLRARALGRRGAEIVDTEFNFEKYAKDLLGMAQAPRVSVIVPNYNYGRYLKERLGSIARQSLAPAEILVLDDASTDDSVAIIQEFAASSGIACRLARNEENSGSVFRQWRKGVEMAQGDLVWIAEADDLADPDFLREVVRPFALPDVVMSYSQSRQIDAQGKQISADYLNYVSDIGRARWTVPYIVDGREEIAAALAVKNTIPNVSAIVFRREKLLSVFAKHADEILSLRHAGDWMTYLRLLEHGRIAFTPKALNAHRRHQGSVTIGNFNIGQLGEILRVQKDTIRRHGLPTETERAADLYARHLYKEFGLAKDNPDIRQHPDLRQYYS